MGSRVPVPTVVQQGVMFSQQKTESLIVMQYNRKTYTHAHKHTYTRVSIYCVCFETKRMPAGLGLISANSDDETVMMMMMM